jgi:alpha-aminoadipic semialdehyde synthase
VKASIGLRRESVDATEKRAPLTPQQVSRLTGEFNLRVVVQPSSLRVFSDDEYARSGAEISEDLTGCGIIFGVSEIPIEHILPGHAYCFFSRTIKAQRYNMPMLRHILESGCTLLDYELVTNDSGSRLIFSGDFAGMAGMIDCLWALGRRLDEEGVGNPFRDVLHTPRYPSLEEARRSVIRLGQRIRDDGLDEGIAPFVCAFTGKGRASRGAQRIFDLLPAVTIRPDDLPTLASSGAYSGNAVYKVEFGKADLYAPADSDARFDEDAFDARPAGFRAKFHRYLVHMTMIVNGIEWTPRYEKLVRREHLRDLYRGDPGPKLKVIGDVTREAGGSFESTVRVTSQRDPAYVYDPHEGKDMPGFTGNGPVVLAVENLSAELPREASRSIGQALLPHVPALSRTGFDRPFDDLNLPECFRRAVIAHGGRLTRNFRYLNEYLL